MLQARELTGELTGPGGFPVASATVEILETGESKRTDGLGAFTLAEVPEGAFTLRVTADDFEPVEVSGSAATTHLSVALTEIRSNTASIEVVARAEDLRTAIPGSLHVIGKSDLVATKPIDANEVLRQVPGVNLREDSGPVATRLNVGMRGLNPNRSRKVLVLEDGIPVALARMASRTCTIRHRSNG